MARRPQQGGLPSRQQILDFIAASDAPAGKREIARAFGLKGNEKIALKQMLRDMGDEGLIDAGPGRAFHKMGGVPKVTVLRVADVDDSGRAWAVPERWEADGRAAAAPGDGAQGARARRSASATASSRGPRRGATGWIAHPMKKLLKGSELVLGVVHQEGDRALAAAGREEGAARAADFRSRRGAGRRSGAGREGRAAAAAGGAGRHHPRRSLRAAQLQPDRDPQARHPARISGRRDRRGGAGGEAAISASAKT